MKNLFKAFVVAVAIYFPFTASSQNDVTITVDVKANNKPISPYIYGRTNFNWISFVKDSNTGIKTLNDTGFEIFPNPASKELKIRSTGFEYDKIEICDINGKVLYSKESHFEPEQNITINLTNGFYLVVLSNSTEKRIKKVIVNN